MHSEPWSCVICGAHDHRQHTFREMMFGFRDEFAYAECNDCGCIQIMNVPDDMEKYYPPYYYSFNRTVPLLKRQPWLKRLLGDIRMKRVYRKTENNEIKMLALAGVKVQDRILDIGCGNGDLICRLFNKGFQRISGVDKFIPVDINYGFGIKIQKTGLEDLSSSEYDFLMMNHVLEHMDDQLKELQQCHRVLRPDSFLMVRVPIKSKAWEIYGRDWVQLDAPRHFFLHTVKSIHLLAGKAGFVVKKIMFDSSAFQFLGSELYKRDIPLHLSEKRTNQLFSEQEIQDFEYHASRLNAHNTGDQAAFYLYKK